MADKNVQQDRFIITLTDHAPIRISKEKWPVIASVNESICETDVGSSSDNKPLETGSMRLIVRQNADGRTIVYGVSENEAPCGNPDFTYNRRHGELLPAHSDLVAAIKRVGSSLCIREDLIHDCIASLPAVDLD